MTSTALAPITDVELETMQRTAKMMLASGFFGGRGEEGIAQIAVKIMAGREMGYGPFASVRGIHVIQGTPALSANLMAAAVKGSGRYDYRIRTMTDQECVIEFFENIGGQRESLGMSPFTLADAKKAGTKNLDKFARNMLFARAMSNGVRWYCPDVFSGNAVYVPEELGADVDGETGEIIQGSYKNVPPVSQPRNGNGKPPAAVSIPGDALDYDAGQGDAHADDGSYDNPFSEPAPWQEWAGAQDAYEWAISTGACQNEFEARGSMRKVVEAHPEWGGRIHGGNKAEVFRAFYNRQLEKLSAETE